MELRRAADNPNLPFGRFCQDHANDRYGRFFLVETVNSNSRELCEFNIHYSSDIAGKSYGAEVQFEDPQTGKYLAV